MVAGGGGLDRQARLIRLFCLVVLLTGVVARHSVVFTSGGYSHAPSHADPTVQVVVDTQARIDDAAVPCEQTGGCDCNAHGALHPCVFVLTDGPTTLPVGTIVWIGANEALWRSPGLRLERRHSERAPPDEAPSLAQLSVLRI